MNPPTSKTRTLTDIMLAIFRLNRRLLESGDTLVKPLGINSARWQVLGAVALAGKPLSAPQIADAMGITRQGAQKQLNKMVTEGFFTPHPNPRHERSPTYALTERGESAFAAAMALETVWAAGLAEAMADDDLSRALNVLTRLQERLESPVASPEIQG